MSSMGENEKGTEKIERREIRERKEEEKRKKGKGEERMYSFFWSLVFEQREVRRVRK